MSALLQPQTELLSMQTGHLAQVMQIESRCYSFPWTHGNFVDSLAAGYPARVLVDRAGTMLGYFVAMTGIGEMHLLNVTVAPEHQGRRHASTMLAALEQMCRQERLPQLWLEVRRGNQRALAIYRHHGFAEVGCRRDYYPAALGRREDAVVMRAWVRGIPGMDRPDAVE